MLSIIHVFRYKYSVDSGNNLLWQPLSVWKTVYANKVVKSCLWEFLVIVKKTIQFFCRLLQYSFRGLSDLLDRLESPEYASFVKRFKKMDASISTARKCKWIKWPSVKSKNCVTKICGQSKCLAWDRNSSKQHISYCKRTLGQMISRFWVINVTCYHCCKSQWTYLLPTTQFKLCMAWHWILNCLYFCAAVKASDVLAAYVGRQHQSPFSKRAE